MPVKEISNKKEFQEKMMAQYGKLWQSSVILAEWKEKRAKKVAMYLFPSASSRQFFQVDPRTVKLIKILADGEIILDDETVGFANPKNGSNWRDVLKWCQKVDSSV
ncbi:MAG: hypothetical protein GWO20_16370 [Candidatus Korarchaeota archaeon]|nr:hypothetical protein [Candidatus Korarchaeota archaeon]NIU84987.1 hypothetical protein [Candidatus Thorarchaeota archaeon]NIW15009.1 hypothetical protein [Candidatus Thorarchaeota archaeon]NIW53019.1 hypothetical protein [Candidatus Korarchaeota archaeon]